MAKGHGIDSSEDSPAANNLSATPSSAAAGQRRAAQRSKPYDANNSFVKKVATKVSDLIPQRSWISKWFNNSQEEQELQNAETENSEYENYEDKQTQPPPLKRARIRMDVTHPPGTFAIKPVNKKIQNETESTRLEIDSQDFSEPTTGGNFDKLPRFVSSTPAFPMNTNKVPDSRSALNILISEQNRGTTNGTDDNSESSESTSGCSSLIPQTNRQEAPTNTTYNSPFGNRRRFTDDKFSFTNFLQSPRSLLLDNTNRDTLASRRPSFNPTIVSNTSGLERSSSLSSPFYTGKTMFGGANAANLYRSNSVLSEPPQIRPPQRTSVEVNPSTSETSKRDLSGMSHTARRILETLEQFSSPITDARKIPIRDVMGNSSINNSSIATTPYHNRKRQREDEQPRVGLRHLARELVVPTVPDLLRLRRRQKIQNTTMNARKIMSSRASTAAPAPPKEYHIRTEADGEPRHTQLKAKKKTNLDEEETVEAVNLPTVPLPISNLPRFDISLPQCTKPAVTTENQQISKPNKDDSFKFSSPIKLTNEPKNLESINTFTFSKPISPSKASSVLNESTELSKTISIDSTDSVTNTASFPNFIWTGPSQTFKPKEKPKAKEEEMEGPKVASELKTGSVMDFFTKKAASSGDTSDVWECNECLIKNNGNESHCRACKSSKSDSSDDIEIICTSEELEAQSRKDNKLPKTSTKLYSNLNSSPSIFLEFDSIKQSQSSAKLVSSNSIDNTIEKSKSDVSIFAATSNTTIIGKTSTVSSNAASPSLNAFKPTKSSWECPCCMVRNVDTVTTCPCCNTAKPGTVKTSPKRTTESTSSTLTSSSGFGEKFKKPEGSWTCDTCMIQNKADVVKCAACETPKPGANKVSSATATSTITSGTSTLTTSGGFGDQFKKPEGSWTCDSCMLSNKAEATKCIACETPKQGVEATKSSSKLQFAFDMPAGASGFKFGVDKAGDAVKSSTETVNTSKANGFTFGAPASSVQATTTGFSFGIPGSANKDNDSSKTSTTGFSFKPSESVATAATFQFGAKPVEKKENEETSKAPASSATFSFGAPKTDTKLPSSGFVFGSPISATSAKEKEEVKDKSAGKLFASDASSDDKSKQTSTSLFGGLTSESSKSKDEDEERPRKQAKPQTTTTWEPPKSASTGFFNAPTTSGTSSSTFVFGAQSKPSETTATTTIASSLPAFGSSNAPSPVFSFGKPAETTSASTPAATTLQQQTENKTPVMTFDGSTSSTAAPTFGQTNQTQSLFGNVAATPSPAPTVASTDNKPLLFGAPENKVAPAFGESKVPTFGTSTDNKPTTASTIFGAPTATSATTPFGSGSNIFGSSATPSFGTNTAPSIFSTTKSAETTPAAPSLFTFGSSSQPSAPAAGGFNFNAGSNTTASGNAEQQKGIFTFGASSSSSGPVGNGFGSGMTYNATPAATPSFTFNAPKPEATATSSAFGQPATPAAAAPLFNVPSAQPNAQQSAFGTPASVNSAPAAGGFNFGSTSVPSSFSFGSTSAPASGGFNFNAPSNAGAPPTFDPNATPTFNFTAGSAPTAFNATPARKIKKAVRRMPRQ